jgi:hypothetical protein
MSADGSSQQWHRTEGAELAGAPQLQQCWRQNGLQRWLHVHLLLLLH